MQKVNVMKSLLLCGWQPTAGLDWGLGLLLFNPEWWYSVAIVRLSAFLEASPGFQGHKFHWLNNLTLYVWDFPWSPRVAFTRQILPLTKMSPTFISILSNIHRGNHQLLWDFFFFFYPGCSCQLLTAQHQSYIYASWLWCPQDIKCHF